MPDTAYHDEHDDPRRALEQVLGFIGLADTALGRLPPQRWPGATGGVAQLPPVREADLLDTDSVYGRLRHARPIARYSATPARWTRPPSPTGAGALRWEERR